VATRLSRELLEKLYTQDGLSTWAIEKRLGISRSSVYSSLKRFKIPIRSIAQSHVQYSRTNFSGDKIEAAYLTGFAIGDLRVRVLNGGRSETISIGCGSTKRAQIKLFESLFSKYGRVWKGLPDKRGAINVEAFVDKSFSFLLPKRRDYRWCISSRRHFFSFLAGFTDAEGSFFISRGKAFAAWGNYNRKILQFIKDGLLKFGVQSPKLYSDSLKGYVGSHGYARNKNYWHLSLVRKDVVATLLRALEPFLQHEDKMTALVRLRKNLILRGSSI
jgi:hypothetical protein